MKATAPQTKRPVPLSVGSAVPEPSLPHRSAYCYFGRHQLYRPFNRRVDDASVYAPHVTSLDTVGALFRRPKGDVVPSLPRHIWSVPCSALSAGTGDVVTPRVNLICAPLICGCSRPVSRQLAPYADDLFSAQGMFPDFRALPTAAFPNILNALPLPWQSQAVVVSLAGFAIALTVASAEAVRAAICVALWYCWAALWNRNPFISNPGLPMVGWTLLACALWPSSSGHMAPVPREARKHWPALFWARMIAANVLGLWGLLQIAAHILGLPGLRGLAAASVASPLPLVFTACRGHETFSNTFHFDAEDVEGGTYRGIIGYASRVLARGCCGANEICLPSRAAPSCTRASQLLTIIETLLALRWRMGRSLIRPRSRTR